MKVALCISGLMRTYKHTARSLLEYICNHYDTDIFISTWHILGHSLAKFAKRKEDKAICEADIGARYNFKIRKLNVHDFMVFREEHKTDWIREKYDWTKKDNLEGISRVEHLYAMCYKIKDCNEIKNAYAQEHGVNYDAVIRCRADMHFEAKLNLKRIKPNTVYTPSLYTWGMVNDQFAYGDTASMNTYCSWYDYLDEYDRIDWMNITTPESVLQYHLKTHNIEQIEDGGISYHL